MRRSAWKIGGHCTALCVARRVWYYSTTLTKTVRIDSVNRLSFHLFRLLDCDCVGEMVDGEGDVVHT